MLNNSLQQFEVYGCNIFGGSLFGALQYGLEEALETPWVAEKMTELSFVLDFDYTNGGTRTWHQCTVA